MMAAKARTLAVTAASSGELARMVSRLARSVAAIRSGLVMIHPATARGFGGTGAGGGMTAFPRKWAR
jgi:hypothetical protein